MADDARQRSRSSACAIDPETDSAPRWQTYEVPFTDDMSVLQGLQYIKDHLDGSLTLPLVLPHGDLRQLRHDAERRAEARPARPSCATTIPARCASSR